MVFIATLLITSGPTVLVLSSWLVDHNFVVR